MSAAQNSALCSGILFCSSAQEPERFFGAHELIFLVDRYLGFSTLPLWLILSVLSFTTMAPPVPAVLSRTATHPQGRTPEGTVVARFNPSRANQVIVNFAGRFTPDSKLHALLADKCPDLIDREKLDYALNQVWNVKLEPK